MRLINKPLVIHLTSLLILIFEKMTFKPPPQPRYTYLTGANMVNLRYSGKMIKNAGTRKVKKQKSITRLTPPIFLLSRKIKKSIKLVNWLIKFKDLVDEENKTKKSCLTLVAPFLLICKQMCRISALAILPLMFDGCPARLLRFFFKLFFKALWLILKCVFLMNKLCSACVKQ